MTNIERAEWWWNTDWPDWSIWASAGPAILGEPGRSSSCTWAATVANLTLVAGKIGLSGRTDVGSNSWGTARAETVSSVFDFLPARFPQILTPALLAPTLLLEYISPNKAFRPDF